MMESSIKSPFKFLEPFDRTDHEVFFERDDDVDHLYDLVCKNRMVLVYGPSGAGKTSLVQCGLFNRFDITDWKPFIIRRGQNINHSMMQALHQSKALGGTPMHEQALEPESEKLLQTIELAAARYLRPIYFIFDQFEELLLLGSEEEIAQFISNIQTLTASRDSSSCNLIFIVNEEYFGWLGLMEKAIPKFSERRMRVDPVSRETAAKIVSKSFDHFNIATEEGQDVIGQIINVVAPGKSAVSLPYLQVYLDQLWKDDYNRTYSEKPYTGSLKHPQLYLTLQEVQKGGDFKQVLGRFLADRKEAIVKELRPYFTDFNTDQITAVLDSFVTGYGTKLSLPCIKQSGNYIFESEAPHFIESMPLELRNRCLDELVDNRIMRFENGRMELAHDTLAALISEQRTEAQRMQYEVAINLENAYQEFKRTGSVNDYLPLNKVQRYEEYIDGLSLDPEVLQFFKKSKRHGENELYKRARAMRKNRRMGIWAVLATIFFTVVAFLAVRYGRNANNNYGLVYLGYNIDSVSDKKAALQLAAYLYNALQNRMGSADKQLMQTRIAEQFQHQAIQGLFADAGRTLQATNMAPDEFALSGNGDFAVYRNDANNATGGGTYELLDVQHNKPVTIEGKVLYAYFIDTETALVAFKDKKAIWDTLQQFADYPTAFALLRCREFVGGRSTGYDTVQLGNGYLYSRAAVLDNLRSEYDSYRIRSTSSGNLLVPYLRKGASDNNFSRQLRIIIGGRSISDQASSSTISHSKDYTSFITGYYQNKAKPVIQVHDQSGKVLQRLDGIYFADFTEKGSLIYIDKGNLVLRKKGDEATESTFVHPAIDYAYADGDEQYAVMKMRKDTVFVLNLASKKAVAFRGKLAGVNFKEQRFIAQTDSSGNYTLKVYGFDGQTLYQRSFQDSIMQVVYNKPADALLVLLRARAGRYHLLLLNNKMETVAGYRLTPNDLFGFSQDGRRMYYVRDNGLSIFTVSDKLINHLDFKESYDWLQRQPWLKDSLKERRAQYNLKLPVRYLPK